MKRFIFDVDGTLTPSRGIIVDSFRHWFLEFIYDNSVYLVTGSDNPKTVEQLGSSICDNVDRIYNCNGNSIWEHGVNTYNNDWRLPEEAHNWLSERLTESDFPVRTGLHFEHRPGMVNFSIVGRNADKTQRAHYVKWDKERDERVNIAAWFNTMFSDIEARVGGETGLDIAPKGLDKSQILKDFDPQDELHFFGDAMHKDGNDYPLMKKIVDNNHGYCYNITNYEATWKILKQL